MYWNKLKSQTLVVLAIVLALALGLAAAPASAGKPSWAGGDKEKHAKSSKKHEKEKTAKKEKATSKKAKHDEHFRYQHEDVVRNYYRKEFRDGKDCPPGLAKKDNGCMPPGQAKKQWTTGEPLPNNVVHHDLPHQLLSKLPVPPDGQRYVRVISDILLVGVDTDVVIDAIVDLAIP